MVRGFVRHIVDDPAIEGTAEGRTGIVVLQLREEFSCQPDGDGVVHGAGVHGHSHGQPVRPDQWPVLHHLAHTTSQKALSVRGGSLLIRRHATGADRLQWASRREASSTAPATTERHSKRHAAPLDRPPRQTTGESTTRARMGETPAT